MSLLDGDEAIAKHLTDVLGFKVSRDSVKRWRNQKSDPLPVRRWSSKDDGGKPRVLADCRQVEEWARRRWAA